MTLALLITAAAGAWADSFSADAYTANATLNAVSVSTNQTVTINKGVTVTVNNGLTIQSNATLTITGGGTLVVNGATGDDGNDDYGSNPTAGGPGGAAITINGSAQLALSNATVIANGGQGGQGGRGMNGADPFWAASGANGNGFASFPTIEGAVLSYSTNGTDYAKYESGNTTLYRYMKVEPAVTINQDAETKQYEASFKMPQYDVTASYTLKRDMTVDVSAELASRIRIRKSGPAYVAVNETEWLPVVTDKLDGDNPVEMINYTDYNRELEKQGTTADEWSYASTLSVGTFRWKITGKGNYTGTIYSNEFQLYEGYEVEVPAGEYITYYKDEALKVEDADAKLYTITAVDETAATATLSDAMTVTPANTPLLVYNSSETDKTFLLIPTTDEADNVTAADEFKGTLEATQIAASTTTQNNYAFNGKAFVWVKNDIAIAANKAWLEIGSGAAGARSVVLVFSDSLTGVNLTPDLSEGEGAWYDLSGRKLQGKPTKSGVYINNGKKVTIK